MTVLLLDVMGTLVREPFYEDVPAFFGMSLEALLRDKHPQSWIDFEHGRIDEPTYLQRFFADGREVDGPGLLATMEAGFELLPGVAPLLDALKAAGVPMHALSNYPVWWRRIEARLRLSRWLEWSFVSCELDLRKPDPAIYLEAARRLDRTPSDCLFVDDRLENVRAAEGVGMVGIVFRDAATLRTALEARGVLS
jgi:FMN phosphatase YigB (HAD superfamily)